MADVGRPTKFKDEYCEQATNYCLLGATDKQLADFFGVSEQTINTWKKEHPEFLESIKRGKDRADAEVAQSLFHRATGYSHDEDKIFNNNGEPLIVKTKKFYPPDTVAGIFWLKNRRSEEWRDKKEIDLTRKDDVSALTDEELAGIATAGRTGAAKPANSKKVTH